MANYKEKIISGSTWTRSVSVHIENPYNHAPNISFDEEDVYVIGNEIIHKPVLKTINGSLREYLGDSTIEFDIVDPKTDEFVRKATYMEIYTTIYSLYKTLALRRDASTPVTQVAPVVPVVPVVPVTQVAPVVPVVPVTQVAPVVPVVPVTQVAPVVSVTPVTPQPTSST